MNVTGCTPEPTYRGPVRVSHSEYGWDPEEMVGHDPVGDVAFLATGERVERRWVLREGCHRRDCPHRGAA